MLKTAYHEVLAFRNIYEEQNKDKAQIKLENWIKRVHEKEMKDFAQLPILLPILLKTTLKICYLFY